MGSIIMGYIVSPMIPTIPPIKVAYFQPLRVFLGAFILNIHVTGSQEINVVNKLVNAYYTICNLQEELYMYIK